MIVDYLEKIYSIVDNVSEVDAIENKYRQVLFNLKTRISELKFQDENISFRLKTLYSEIADSITGNSTYTPEQLSEAITELRSTQDSVRSKLSQLQNEMMDRGQLRTSIHYRMDEIQRMLNRFFAGDVKFEEKRVIVNKMFESVTLGRGTNDKYNITFKLREEFVDFFNV